MTAADNTEDEEGQPGFAAALRVLASPSRLRILSLASRSPVRPREVATALDVSDVVARKHLGRLKGRYLRSQDGGFVVIPDALRHTADLLSRLADGADIEELDQEFDVGRGATHAAPRKRTPWTPPTHDRTLLELRGSAYQGRHPLDAQSGWSALVGRSDACAIRLEHDLRVSSVHAVVRYDGGLFIADNQSRTGTWLNGRRLRDGDRMPIRLGDVVQVGDTLLVVQ